MELDVQDSDVWQDDLSISKRLSKFCDVYILVMHDREFLQVDYL